MINKAIFTSLIVLFLLISVIFPTTAKAKTTFSLVDLVDVLISVGAISSDNLVQAKVFAANYDKDQLEPNEAQDSYIQILDPVKAVVWEMDQDISYEIKWGSEGMVSTRLALVGSKNTCELTYNPLSTKNGEHTYKILPKNTNCYDLSTAQSTKLMDGSYRLRIYGVNANGGESKKDSSFSINIKPIPIPSIKVTAPNGGENLSRREDYNVKYTLTNFEKSIDDLIYFRLIDKDGNSAYNGHKALRKGTFSIDFPGSLPVGSYKLKLSVTTNEQRVLVEDESDNFFWINSGF